MKQDELRENLDFRSKDPVTQYQSRITSGSKSIMDSSGKQIYRYTRIEERQKKEIKFLLDENRKMKQEILKLQRVSKIGAPSNPHHEKSSSYMSRIEFGPSKETKQRTTKMAQ